MVLVMGQVALASPPNDCQDVINDCNIALNKADGVIKAQNDEIIRYTTAYAKCTSDNQEIRMDLQNAVESRDAWYRNPVVTVLGGIVLGLVAGTYLTK